jgi:hypothetical protein
MIGGLHHLDMLSRTVINAQDSRLCRHGYRRLGVGQVLVPGWLAGVQIRWLCRF